MKLDILVIAVPNTLFVLIFGENSIGTASQEHHSHQEGNDSFGRHSKSTRAQEGVDCVSTGCGLSRSLVGWRTMTGSAHVEKEGSAERKKLRMAEWVMMKG